MTLDYDCIFFGNGPSVRFISNFLELHNVKVLIVTNHIEGALSLHAISYQNFFSNQNEYRAKKIVLALKQSKERESLLEEIYSFISLQPRGFDTVVLFSSSAVYGENLNEISETDALNGITEYALSKIESERRIQEATSDYLILRISNLYGVRQLRGVVSKLLNDFEAGCTLELPISSVYRNFVHISDLSNFLLQIMNSKTPRGIVNFSSDYSITLDTLVDLLFECVGSSAKVIRNLEMPSIAHSILSNAKLYEVYPHALVDPREGIRMMYTSDNV